MEEEIVEFLGLGPSAGSPVDFDSRLFCPMCLIKKPYKTRHVKKLNLCVKDFHFYSKFFDKIVFGKNIKWFLLGLILNTFMVVVYLALALCSYSITFDQPFWMFFVEFAETDSSLISKLLFLVNLALLLSFLIDMWIQAACLFWNLTYDELIRPQHYPYLFTKINDTVLYQNPNHFGFLSNIRKSLFK